MERIRNLKKGFDTFNEFKKKQLKNKKIKFLNKLKNLDDCNLFIVTVPTPIFKNKNPDLSHLNNVCKKLSKAWRYCDLGGT